MNNENARRLFVSLFFAALVALGLGIYRDYGVSWDEPQQREIGAVTVKYLAEKFAPAAALKLGNRPPLEKFANSDYGPAFEAPLFALEMLLDFSDSRDVVMFRHLATFLVCLLGVYAVYRTASRRFTDWRVGLLAASFLVLTPRLFAESFYNSKDAVFMAAFAAAMCTTVSFVLRPGIRTALLHALATAVAIDLRVVAVILPVASISFLIMRLARKELPMRKTAAAMAAYSFAACVLVVALWPYLWSDPFRNFMLAFERMSRFGWDQKVLYMGRLVPGADVPWHYIPAWISITTPVLYLALFLAGLFAVLRRMAARLAAGRLRLWADEAELQDAVFLALLAAPVAAVILLGSTLYDGWRQMYFIYPAFILLAVRGWVSLWRASSPGNTVKALLLLFTSVSVLHTAVWIWKAHPLQNVYFNLFAGKDIKDRFEMDYWGLANRKALEYILENDRSPVINVRADSVTPLDHSLLILSKRDRQRLRNTPEKAEPYYVLNNYRLFTEPVEKRYGKDYDLFYEIRVDGEVVVSVFKWKGT